MTFGFNLVSKNGSLLKKRASIFSCERNGQIVRVQTRALRPLTVFRQTPHRHRHGPNGEVRLF